MTLLILGIVLWIAAHSFKRLAPDIRADLGKGGRPLIAGLIVASVLAMIFGYKWAPVIPVWSPPSFMVHINNLAMLIAFFVYGMSATTGRLRGKLRHPQLTAVKIWAVAHLSVNGDLASILLFGGMLTWAIGSVVLINKSEPDWQRPVRGEAKKDIILVVITLVMFSVVAAIHIWAGPWPFPR
ncbi:MAG: NnrU family protein [Tateyamaria sp.]|uniref:NnrU family protein n=1 Tax=Tateyamaria sp. TaxID=1929288 RepID=UPI0032A09ED2